MKKKYWTVTEPAAGHFRLEYGNELMAKTDDGKVFHKWCDAVMQTNPEIPEQPSEPTAEKKSLSWLDCAAGVADEDDSPTADVEKIARELAEKLRWLRDEHGKVERMVEIILPSLAQARAPLVEAINNAIAVSGEGQTMFAIATIRAILRAALTGTGEKECQG